MTFGRRRANLGARFSINRRQALYALGGSALAMTMPATNTQSQSATPPGPLIRRPIPKAKGADALPVIGIGTYQTFDVGPQATHAAEMTARYGIASVVRAIETLGEALVDIRRAPDPRLVLEVTLVRLASNVIANDTASLVARVERLEQLVPTGMDLPELALRFILAHPAVGTVIPGMRRTAHVERNLAASDGAALPPRLLDALRAHRWDRDLAPSP